MPGRQAGGALAHWIQIYDASMYLLCIALEGVQYFSAEEADADAVRWCIVCFDALIRS